jgi:hypothetical protein
MPTLTAAGTFATPELARDKTKAVQAFVCQPDQPVRVLLLRPLHVPVPAK